MTIDELINELNHIKKKHGGSVNVKVEDSNLQLLTIVNVQYIKDQENSLTYVGLSTEF